MDSPDAPTPPNPKQTANAQLGYTKQTLGYLSGLNAPNINTPYGSVTYDHNADGSVSSQNVSLSPQLQGLLNQQYGLSGGLLGKANDLMGQFSTQGLDPNNLGVDMPGHQDYSAYGDKVAQASFDKARGLLDPVFAQQNRTLEQSLADRGQPNTGEGYNMETGNQRDAQNRAYTDAANNAELSAGQEMSRLSGIQNQDYNTALNANVTAQNLPYQQFAGLLSSNPQFQTQQQQQTASLNAAPPDYQGAVQNQYQGLLSNYNSQMQQQNALYGALGSLGGSALGAGLMPGGFLR